MIPVHDSDTLEYAIALASADPSNCGVVDLPPGDLPLQRPVLYRDCQGLWLRGNGTRFVYDGAYEAGRGVVEFESAQGGKLTGVQIVLGSGQADAAIRLCMPAVGASSGRVTTACVFEDVRVNYSSQRFRYGVWFDASLRDANNEHHQFLRCTITGYTVAGAYCTGSQCHRLIFEKCDFGPDPNVGGDYGWLGWYGNFVTFRDCVTNNHREADFYFRDFSAGPCVIENNNGENSRRFIQAGGNPGFVSVRNARWAGKPQSGDLAIDYRPSYSTLSLDNVALFSQTDVPCVVLSNGPLDIRNCQLTQASGVVPWERSVIVPDGVTVLEGNNMVGLGAPNLRPLIVRPAPDLTRGLVFGPANVPVPPPESSPIPRIDLSGFDMSQGWAVAGTFACDADYPDVNPCFWTLVSAGGDPHGYDAPAKFYHLDGGAPQDRIDGGGGGGINVSQPLPAQGRAVEAVQWYDRQTGECGLYLDGVSHVSQVPPGTVVPVPDVLMIGGQSDVWGTRFSGTVTGLRVWNRRLYAEELALL